MKHGPIRQTVFPILAALIWGTAFVAQDVCADSMDAFTFNTIRSTIAVVVLYAYIRLTDGWKKKRHPEVPPQPVDRKQLWIGGFLTGLALCVSSNLQQAGLGAGTDAGKAGFITALYVVLVPLCGLFFKRKISLTVWIAVGLSVIGLYLLCVTGGFRLSLGDTLLLLCAFCFTVHILVIDHFSVFVDGVKLSCAQFFFNAVFSALGMLLFGSPKWESILACAVPLLYVGVFSSCIAYTLQILAQKGSNPTVVTILLSLESVFAVIASAIILHQRMSGREYLGCAIMFAAVILAQLEFPRKKKGEDLTI